MMAAPEDEGEDDDLGSLATAGEGFFTVPDTRTTRWLARDRPYLSCTLTRARERCFGRRACAERSWRREKGKA